MLAQLHILFVVEIHHHEQEAFSRASPTQIRPSGSHSQDGPSEGKFCAACQIARNGLVNPAINTWAPVRFPERAKLLTPADLKPFLGFQVHLTGRSPPSFS
jgi:hypothetical protein